MTIPTFSTAFHNIRAEGFNLLEQSRITIEQYAFVLSAFELALKELEGRP